MAFKCNVCSKFVSSRHVLKTHVKRRHNMYLCSICLKTFKDDNDLKIHRAVHKKCGTCNKIILKNYFRHIRKCDKKGYKEFNIIDCENIKDVLFTKLYHSPLPIKWILSSQVQFVKYAIDDSGNAVVNAKSNPTFKSKMTTLTNKSQLIEQINLNIDKIYESFDTYQKEGSGWQYVRSDNWLLKIYRYLPLKATSYIPTPKTLLPKKKSILNIKNCDNKCFLWCVLASLYPPKYKNPVFVCNYLKYERQLNMTDIPYPVDVKHISRFENMNNISVNVFCYCEETITPIRITKSIKLKHVNLLVLHNGRRKHFCLITNFDSLLSNYNKEKKYYCYYCLRPQYNQSNLDKHINLCIKHEHQVIKLPKYKTIKFTNYRFKLKIPYVIYGDFECFISDNGKHTPSGFCLVVVDSERRICKTVTYSDSNIMDTFFKVLFNIVEEIEVCNCVDEPCSMTEIDKIVFENATLCHICKKPLNGDSVRDHDHRTGRFRGAAHNCCNLNYKESKKIPVIFHNLKNYDGHLIVQELGKYLGSRKINVIAKDTEKYISFSIENIQFLDSYNFLSASISKLAKTLDNFRYVTEPLLQQKGVYPYEFMQSQLNFSETLPPIEKFYSRLRGKGIKPKKYQHAINVWNYFNIKNMKQYHNLYLKTDTLLLAEVFEVFRDLCLKDYGIDPCHVYSLPGVTWQAALKYTDIELDLIRNDTMSLLLEEGIRGGISMISTKYSKANNKYMGYYDPTQESKYIIYLDCNSLYSTAMMEPLPYSDFKYSDYQTYLNNNDENIGFILQVDLEYPKYLHDLHNDYPLAPV